MATKRRRFTAEPAFKKRVALDALRGDHTIQAVAAKHKVHPSQVSSWNASGRGRALNGGVFERALQTPRTEPRIDDSGCGGRDCPVIGELTVERDFFLARVLGRWSRSERLVFRMLERNGALSERRQCRLLEIQSDRISLRVLHAEGGERGEPGADASPGLHCIFGIRSTGQPAVATPTCAAKGSGSVEMHRIPSRLMRQMGLEAI